MGPVFPLADNFGLRAEVFCTDETVDFLGIANVIECDDNGTLFSQAEIERLDYWIGGGGIL